MHSERLVGRNCQCWRWVVMLGQLTIRVWGAECGQKVLETVILLKWQVFDLVNSLPMSWQPCGYVSILLNLTHVEKLRCGCHQSSDIHAHRIYTPKSSTVPNIVQIWFCHVSLPYHLNNTKNGQSVLMVTASFTMHNMHSMLCWCAYLWFSDI